MKTLKIAALAAGVLLLAGCGNKVAQNNSDNTGADNSGASKTEEKGAVGGVISSIKDAMASGKAMQCTYTIKNKEGGDIVSTMYVDGKKYAGTTNVAGTVQHMIFNEEAMYSWSEGQKTGMKMTTACSEELAAKAPKSQNDNAPTPPATDSEKTFDNALNVKCEPNSGGDFTVPSDITFADQCEMLKGLQKNMPGGVNIPNMPAGAAGNVPSVMPQVQQ
jgi:hypothetical protein